jgi:hypothetical protein
MLTILRVEASVDVYNYKVFVGSDINNHQMEVTTLQIEPPDIIDFGFQVNPDPRKFAIYFSFKNISIQTH